MGLEQIVLGTLAMLLGLYVLLRTGDLILAVGFIALGLALLLFNKAEDTIEKRKDLQTNTNKKTK